MSSIAPTIRQKIQIPYNYSAGPAVTKFLRGLQQKIIYASACAGCGRKSVPPIGFCGRCWQPIETFVPVEQSGIIESFVTPAALPPELVDESHQGLSFALIRLQDCSTNMVHLVKTPPGSSIAIGARVRAMWKEERTASILDIACFVIA
jgi:uncharacterized OB-fold protein